MAKQRVQQPYVLGRLIVYPTQFDALTLPGDRDGPRLADKLMKDEGSAAREANNTGRQAASGRRAHHRWSVEG